MTIRYTSRREMSNSIGGSSGDVGVLGGRCLVRWEGVREHVSAVSAIMTTVSVMEAIDAEFRWDASTVATWFARHRVDRFDGGCD